MRTLALLILINTLTFCNILFAQEVLCSQGRSNEQDSILFYKKVKELKELSGENTANLFAKTGRSFVGYPYTHKTLETDNAESLVVNFREFDCTTFVETCLAFSLTLKSENITFENFKHYLKEIRYRDGNIENYDSRLHYFCDWITDNQKKGFITDTTKYFGGTDLQKPIDFMSTHIGSYIQLKNDSTLVPGIREIEKEISARNYFYIPKENIGSIESRLEEGMIVAITSDIKGLDIAHTGILVRENGQIHLLHASSDAGKVVISEKTFLEYIIGNKRQTGAILLKVK
jgi:hypothetical protein